MRSNLFRPTFDAKAEAERLARKANVAMHNDCETVLSDLQFQVHVFSECELNALALELEKRFRWRWVTPYARVIRAGQKVKGLRFYPGLLDVVNFGKTLLIQTFALELSGNSQILNDFK